MNNNVLKYLAVFVLLVNVVSLAFFLMNQPPEKPENTRLKPSEMVSQALYFNQEQQVAYKKLHEQHRRTHDNLVKQIDDKRKALYAQNTNAIEAITQEIGLLHQQVEITMYQHFQEVRKICKPEQQVELDKRVVKFAHLILCPPPHGERPPLQD
jgi:periplasmic protein CpxP/Spy